MDIFISYRRDTGKSQAALIKSELEKRNIKVFLDVNNINNDDFVEKIHNAIDHCPNFLMVVTDGYFKKRRGKQDYVREEIKYALEKGKNIIGIMDKSSYNPDDMDWDLPENEEIRILEKKNIDPYQYGNDAVTRAFYETSIIKNMLDHKGNRFSTKKKLEENSWYSDYGKTEEDMLWIKTDHTVCRGLDWEILEKATEEKIFEGRTDLNLLCYKAYDIATYKKKYDLRPRKKGEKELTRKITGVYGVCFEDQLEEADNTFGVGHFSPDIDASEDSEGYFGLIEDIMKKNNIDGFDLIDCTLVLKDGKRPDKAISRLSEYLSKDGGIIYIRELDDDYIDMYPDEKQILQKLRNLLDLDKGAGNRHLGKTIYTTLRHSGAKKVYMSDKIISSANYDPNFHAAMFMNYFSYLKPEFEASLKKHQKKQIQGILNTKMRCFG